MRPQNPAIPVFRLYGGSNNWPTPDLIHCESIAERSRIHDWEIKAHRHTDLIQLLYFQKGEASASIDGYPLILQPPCVLLIAPMSVHGFKFSQNIEGYVLSLATPLLKQLGQHLGEQQSILHSTHYYPLKQSKKMVETLFTTINQEYTANVVGRELLLESMVNALMIILSRQVVNDPTKSSTPLDRGAEHFARFSRQIEQYYRSQRPLDEYASTLGITTAYLNALCRRFANRTALQLLHDRLLLEAKRNLIYTAMTISQISDSLGFSEPSYFTRFFKRLTGVSPKSFRTQRTY